MPRPRTRCRSGWLVALAAAAWCALVPPAQATGLYRIDQRVGSIGFAIGVLGLFSIDGRFPEFAGELRLDVGQPQRSSIDVTVRTAVLEVPVPEQVELLRSAAYFDTAHHPSARFVSHAVEPLSPTHYAIRGTLTLRGITRPLDLDARLDDRRRDGEHRAEIADFVVTGAVSRAAFGMVADRPMLADEVRLTIRIRLALGTEPGGG